MKIKLDDTGKFLSLIKLVKNINNETNLFFKPDGISINVIDPSNVFLVNIFIKKEFFEEYEIESEIGFGLDFEIIEKIISSMKKFVMTDDEENLIFKGGRMVRKLKKYVASDEEKKNLPTNHGSLYKLKLDELIQSMKISAGVGDVTQIKKNENIKIFTKSRFEEFEKEIEFENVGDEKEQEVWFSSSYILKIESLTKIFDDIVIGLDEELPIYFKCNDNNIELCGWLAPRAKHDEE